MTTELEVLVGHLLIVGGRAVSVPPPGALAELAPRRAPRVREGDVFAILVTPAEGTRTSSAFLEELARLGADTYFGSSGGVTGGLRDAFAAINQHLVMPPTQVEGRKQVNALALVLRGTELTAARSGRIFSALLQGDALAVFPTDRRDPLTIALPPLGSSPEPESEFARYTLAPGQAMLLADAGLLEAGDDTLRAALGQPGVRAILDRAKEVAAPQASIMAIQFVAPGTPDPDHLAPQASTRAPRAAPLRSARPTAPTAFPAAPPAPAEPPPPAPAAVPLPQALPGPALALDEEDLGDEDENGAPEAEAPVRERARQVLDRVSDAALKAAESSREQAPSAFERVTLGVRRAVRDVLRLILGGLLRISNGFLRIINIILPGPDSEGRQGISTEIAVVMAILIPLVIVIVVVGLALSRQGETEFEQYLERAEKAHQEALAASGDQGCPPADLRPTWDEVMKLANQAAEFRPEDSSVLQIQADAQNYLDCFDKVTRRTVTLLRDFPAGADLAGPIVQNGVELYTLDRSSGIVYHDTLNERGDGLVGSGDVIIQPGQAINVYTVGQIFDIEWLSTSENVLIGLDRDGILVSYSQTFLTSAEQIVIEDRWQNPVAIAIFRSNLYVLDPGANQIWRYVQPAGERRYSSAPEEYFTGENRPNLTDAADFGISETGEVFVLFHDGHVEKFLSGQPQPFSFGQLPQGTIQGGRALFVDNDPASRNLYLVDSENQSIYETSWSGTFRFTYRPRNDPDAFRDVSGIYADAVLRNNMYVVAGSHLYHFYRN